MKEKMYKRTFVLIFVCWWLALSGFSLNSNEIVSLKIKDTFPGDTPDGFPSPGEKIALNIRIVMDFIPEESYIVSDTELVEIENKKTKFYITKADTLINSSFEPTLLIKKSCPTDMLIPFLLVYRKDTIFDTLSFNIHTVGIVDSCYLDKKVNKTNSKLHIKVSASVAEGFPSGYTGINADIRDSDGEFVHKLKLFDDGKHSDGDEGDGLFSNSWWSPSISRDFVIDIELEDSSMNHSIKTERITGFTTKSFSLAHPYLVVSDPYSDSPDNEVVYLMTELMDSLKIGYDKWNIWFRGYPDSNETSLWGAKGAILVWATKLGGTLKYSSKGRRVIEGFLKNGGNLLLATSYLGNYIKEYGNEADSLFYEDILCSRFVKRFTSIDSIHTLALTNPLTNQISDTFNLSFSLADSNKFVSFADLIEPIPPALPVVSFCGREDSIVTIDTTCCFGVKVKKDNYKIIYLCFSISEISPFSARKSFFEKSLTWLSEETADTFSYHPVLEQTVEVVKLADPYPNPFLEESTIPFTLLSEGDVILIVCDLTGRTVRYLIHSFLNKGNYYAVWDGKDEKGDETAVGYYFIRLAIKTVEKSSGQEIEIVLSKKLLKLRK